jgi:hypothetical protein
MANEKRLINADDCGRYIASRMGFSQANLENVMQYMEDYTKQNEVDAVEVEDKELLKAIKILIEQYGHSKRSEYVHSPVAHALYHTWKKVDEDGRRKERQWMI